jgi:RecB family exonuclease
MGLRCKDAEGNMLIGAVDDVLEQDGKLAVLECTTRGFPLKKDTPWLYQDQLNLYTFLLRKNGFPVIDYGYLLFYYPKEVNWQGDIWFHKRLYELKVSTADAEQLWKKALAVLKGQMPSPSEKCGFCRWGKEQSEEIL